jgi:hypothetical protein
MALKIDMVRLRALVDEQPDATISELHQRLGMNCTEAAVGYALRRMELSFKKRRSMRLSKIVQMSPNVGSDGSRSSPRGTLVA